MKSETPREIAEEIVIEWADAHQVTEVGPGTKARLVTDIETALNAERERCAKIIQDRIDQYALLRSVEGDVVRVFGKQMIDAIRGKD